MGSAVRAVETRRAAVRRAILVAVAVFVSGAVVLGMEIAASRVLAPFFGNSLFVWGALIGVVLAGLALGYWAGGWLADRLPTPSLLAGVMSLGSLFVLAIPALDEPVLEAIVEWDPGPRLNPLFAAIALFGPASFVLAGVAPIAVRLRAQSLTTLGQTAGRLFAISTAGSIAGTFATAFWLIPEFGTDQLLGLAAAALFAAAAVVALSERLIVLTALAAAGIALASYTAVQLAPQTGGTLSAAQATNWSPLYRRSGYDRRQEPVDTGGLRLRYAEDTRYHRLTVADDDTTRYLRFDNSYQSGMVLERPFATAFEYVDLFHLLKAYNPRARDVLFIGLGGGSSPKRLWRDFPDLRLQAVELDPVVVDVAYRFFELPRDERLKVAVDDGRRYLDRTDRRWDAILIDAFFADAIPFHLFTSEFLELARSRLNPGGVILTNTIGAIAGAESRLFRSVYRTYRSVFPTVLVHPTLLGGALDEQAVLNLILVATEGAAPTKEFLGERWEQIRAEARTAPDLREQIAGRYDKAVSLAGVPTLTDQYAPTDALLLIE
ncbi:MAG TPA: fused MFS/spermidine synthase [Gaiellaceae bacterium]|nr:fused MFS/spermidine synthase [Gaiellaceae bacterium]